MDNFNNYIPEGTNDNPNYNVEPFADASYDAYANQSSYNNDYNEQPYGAQAYNDMAYQDPAYGEQAYAPEYTQFNSNSPNYVGQDSNDNYYGSDNMYPTDSTQASPFQNYTDTNNSESNSLFQNYNEQKDESHFFETFEYDETESTGTIDDTSTASTDSVGDSLFTPLYPDGYAPQSEPQSAIRRNPEDEELTEAEIADLKRQEAIKRRKKRAARERRRRERRKQAIIRCSILLGVVILLIVLVVMLISGIVKSAKEKKKQRELSEYYATSEVTTEEPVADIDEAIVAKELPTDRDAALAILQEQAASDSTMQSICDSAAAMPDILLQHLAVNSELKDLTLSYPAKINIVFDGQFDLEVDEGEVPLFLQYDDRWGYADYSKDIIALRGAGPVSLSMAYTYLMSDGTKNPIKIADYATEMGYLDENGKTHWSLMTTGAKAIGLKSTEIETNKDDMIEALENGNVLICKVENGDFTTEESFILIHDYKRGLFYLHDPASKARSEVGWDFKRLRGQIEKIAILEAGEQDSNSNDAGNSTNSSDNTAEGAEDNNQNGDSETENNDNEAGEDTAPAAE